MRRASKHRNNSRAALLLHKQEGGDVEHDTIWHVQRVEHLAAETRRRAELMLGLAMATWRTPCVRKRRDAPEAGPFRAQRSRGRSPFREVGPGACHAGVPLYAEK